LGFDIWNLANFIWDVTLGGSRMTVSIDRIQRDLEQINAFNATPDRGITRLTFSKEYQRAQAYIIEQLRQIDAQISISHGGNLKGRIVGSHARGPAVMLGSQLDTVVNGGRFDGLVEAIVGINQFEVTIEGMANHAGTTAMAHRLDALQGAVRVIAAVEDIALRTAADG
jgi:acetylornithine deacetylase/succinyl-diaminopimelate desuccinylase-like protein